VNESAAVTGIGLITPAGLGRAANWAAVCTAAATAAGVQPGLVGGPVQFACAVPSHTALPRLLGSRRADTDWDRCTQLAVLAARTAVHDARLVPSTWSPDRVGVVMGTGMGGVSSWEDNHRRLLTQGADRVRAMFLPKALVNMLSGAISLDLDARGPNMVVSTACASGATAIGLALGWLRERRCDVVLAGGAEAGITPLFVAGFHKLRALSTRHEPGKASRPFDSDHDGFVMAEGAAVLVLEREEDARARGARVWARVAGFGGAADAHHSTAPHPTARGGRAALRAALFDAGLTTSDIQHVNAHATGTPIGDSVEATLIHEELPQAAVTSTKGVTGHALGAAGAIEAAYTALALHYRKVPPTVNHDDPCPAADGLDIVSGIPRDVPGMNAAVSTSFGFGGHNAVLVLTA
jgi:3-oxoacyl-[acyl-carrier-protein] synthase II